MTDPPDGINNVKIDLNGRMRLPSDFTRALREIEAQIRAERAAQAKTPKPRKKRPSRKP